MGGLSFVPGLQADFMLQPRWLVKLYAQAGIGQDFSGGSAAFIYGAGIRTLTWINVNDYTVSFGFGGLLAAGKVGHGGNDEKWIFVGLNDSYVWVFQVGSYSVGGGKNVWVRITALINVRSHVIYLIYRMSKF